mmetsp:Transcript_45562/g.120380  ORF Transcript_45562/g.120380 Transcript_45562/m.120380 type:complete len:452 (-) Transcript_45562:504-1859(-)
MLNTSQYTSKLCPSLRQNGLRGHAVRLSLGSGLGDCIGKRSHLQITHIRLESRAPKQHREEDNGIKRRHLGLHCLHAFGVVLLPQRCVGQDGVGCRELLKLLFGLLISGTFVRMTSQGFLVIRLFYRAPTGITGDLQQVVVRHINDLTLAPLVKAILSGQLPDPPLKVGQVAVVVHPRTPLLVPDLPGAAACIEGVDGTAGHLRHASSSSTESKSEARHGAGNQPREKSGHPLLLRHDTRRRHHRSRSSGCAAGRQAHPGPGPVHYIFGSRLLQQAGFHVLLVHPEIAIRRNVIHQWGIWLVPFRCWQRLDVHVNLQHPGHAGDLPVQVTLGLVAVSCGQRRAGVPIVAEVVPHGAEATQKPTGPHRSVGKHDVEKHVVSWAVHHKPAQPRNPPGSVRGLHDHIGDLAMLHHKARSVPGPRIEPPTIQHEPDATVVANLEDHRAVLHALLH